MGILTIAIVGLGLIFSTIGILLLIEEFKNKKKKDSQNKY